jgi:hypothetical protein
MTNKYRAIPFRLRALGFGMYALSPVFKECSFLLSTFQAQVLSNCYEFRSLAMHCENCALLLKDQPINDITGIVRDLIDKGLIVSEEQFYKLIPHGADPCATITALVIPTANRLDSVLAALNSILDNMDRHAWKHPRIVILDDSDDEASRVKLLHELSRIAAQGNRTIMYAGKIEKKAFAQRLKRVGIHPDVIAFAVFGNPDNGPGLIGANRNCSLIETLGECFVTSDDDIVWRAARHPVFSESLRVTGDGFAQDVWVAEDRRDALHKANWMPVNILGEHEQLLGISLGNLLSSNNQDAGFVSDQNANGVLISAVRGEGIVTLTMPGIVGDCGRVSPRWMLLSNGRTGENTLQSKTAFDLALRSREIIAVASGQVITQGRFCMGYNLGLDNRLLLPPFVPISRGEDGVFGTTLSTLYPNSFTGHLPFAVLHDSRGYRSYPQRTSFRIVEFVNSLLRTYRMPRPAMRDAALKGFGSYLLELANTETRHFCASISELVQTFRISELHDRFESKGNSGELPPYARDEMIKWHIEESLALTTEHSWIPSELSARFPVIEAIQRTQKLVKNIGRLFYEWPDICDAAQELKLSARGLTKSVTEALEQYTDRS